MGRTLANKHITRPPLTAVYVYAVVRSARKPAPGRVPAGVPGATRPRLEALGGGLWCVLADVPLDAYGPSALEPRLRDLDWVGEIAVGHEAVVEHFARRRGTTVVPMKLFTMFSSAAKAKTEIAEGRRAIERAMRHIGGCDEWGIRVSRADAAAVRAGRGRTAAARRVPTATSGAAFLIARKTARDAEKDARAQAADAAEQAYAALGRLARDVRRRDERPAGATAPPLLEAAFLVPTTARARFTAEARRRAAACAAAGAQMTLTGPWPAYNFVGGQS